MANNVINKSLLQIVGHPALFIKKRMSMNIEETTVKVCLQS